MNRGLWLASFVVAGACSAAPNSSGEAPAAPASAEPGTTEAAPKDAGGQPVPNKEVVSVRTLRFSDGSGNGFVLEDSAGKASLVYSPVTPKHSSSGTYSGGEPATVTLTDAQVAETWRRVEELQKNSASHVGARSMGTGAFVLSGPDGDARFLVRMGDDLSAFTDYMRGLVGQ